MNIWKTVTTAGSIGLGAYAAYLIFKKDKADEAETENQTEDASQKSEETLSGFYTTATTNDTDLANLI